MSERPWDPHHVPTAAELKAAVRAHVPDVDVDGLRPLGSGWEFDVWETPDGWVFRFPRRREAPPQIQRERAFLELVRPVLAPDVRVPEPVLFGEPGPSFPWPFSGYRKVPGVGCDTAGVPRHPDLARQLGRALGRLHAVPEGEARAAGVPEDREGVAEWEEEARERVGELPGRWEEVDRALEWLHGSGFLPEPYQGPLRLIHNDLCPDHVLVDPDTGALTGILDWTDTSLADPALDFVFLATWGGWRLVDEVLESYEGPALDGAFRARLGQMARILSLVWLQEAVVRGGDVEKHLGWVRNAFGG